MWQLPTILIVEDLDWLRCVMKQAVEREGYRVALAKDDVEAFAIGEHGDILVLDMGEPVRIVDLAQSLIRLSGKSERDVEIRFTGLRPGEKLAEELFYQHEDVFATPFEKIKRTTGSRRSWAELCRQLGELRASLTIDGAEPIQAKIKDIVPEYCSEHQYHGGPVGVKGFAAARAVGQN